MNNPNGKVVHGITTAHTKGDRLRKYFFLYTLKMSRNHIFTAKHFIFFFALESLDSGSGAKGQKPCGTDMHQDSFRIASRHKGEHYVTHHSAPFPRTPTHQIAVIYSSNFNDGPCPRFFFRFRCAKITGSCSFHIQPISSLIFGRQHPSLCWPCLPLSFSTTA